MLSFRDMAHKMMCHQEGRLRIITMRSCSRMLITEDRRHKAIGREFHSLRNTTEKNLLIFVLLAWHIRLFLFVKNGLYQWSPTFLVLQTSGGDGGRGRGEEMVSHAQAPLAQMQLYVLICCLCGWVPNGLRTSTGLRTKSWGALIYIMQTNPYAIKGHWHL